MLLEIVDMQWIRISRDIDRIEFNDAPMSVKRTGKSFDTCIGDLMIHLPNVIASALTSALTSVFASDQADYHFANSSTRKSLCINSEFIISDNVYAICYFWRPARLSVNSLATYYQV